MITVEQARAQRAKIQGLMRLACSGEQADNDTVIQAETLADEWKPGNYALNDIRRRDNQVWRCCQAHDSTENPGWYPGAVGALWAPFHGTTPATAKPFIQPTGAHDAYQEGEVCLWTDGKVYRSTMETANAYSPEAYPQGWEQI